MFRLLRVSADREGVHNDNTEAHRAQNWPIVAGRIKVSRNKLGLSGRKTERLYVGQSETRTMPRSSSFTYDSLSTPELYGKDILRRGLSPNPTDNGG